MCYWRSLWTWCEKGQEIIVFTLAVLHVKWKYNKNLSPGSEVISETPQTCEKIVLTATCRKCGWCGKHNSVHENPRLDDHHKLNWRKSWRSLMTDNGPLGPLSVCCPNSLSIGVTLHLWALESATVLELELSDCLMLYRYGPYFKNILAWKR
jgi:hypothetical protein